MKKRWILLIVFGLSMLPAALCAVCLGHSGQVDQKKNHAELMEQVETQWAHMQQLAGAIKYAISLRWCDELGGLELLDIGDSDCTSRDDGYISACLGCTGATACCCICCGMQCPEAAVPAAMILCGGYGAYKVREKYCAKYGLKND